MRAVFVMAFVVVVGTLSADDGKPPTAEFLKSLRDSKIDKKYYLEREKKTPKLTPKITRTTLEKLAKVFVAETDTEVASLKKARWVTVKTLWFNFEGWLIRETKAELKILAPSGFTRTFPRPKPGETPPKKPVSFRSRAAEIAWTVRGTDFAAFCEKFMKDGIPDPPKNAMNSVAWSIHNERAYVVRAARLAHYASSIGNPQLAQKLIAKSRAWLFARVSESHFENNAEPLSAYVAARVAKDMCNVAVRTDSRPEALKLWTKVLRLPPGDHRKTAKTKIASYKSLIAEDKVWKEPSKAAFAKMTPREQAKYWMHKLRDWNVEQNRQPGACNVLHDHNLRGPKLVPSNPALELLRLGFDAMPLVIEHLDDPRPTRCIGFWRVYAPDSYYRLTYGDCCQQIVEAFTGKSIFDRRDTNGYPIKDGKGKAVKNRAQAIWNKLKTQDERKFLAKRIAEPVWGTIDFAYRLVRRFPQHAFDVITKEIERSKWPYHAAKLLAPLGELKGERVIRFLKKRLQDKSREMRTTATRELLKKGDQTGVAILLRDWQTVSPKEADEEAYELADVATCLFRSGEMKAIRALIATLGRKPKRLRSAVSFFSSRVTTDWNDRPLSPEVLKLLKSIRPPKEAGEPR